MSHPDLAADLAAALEFLQRELGPLQVLDVHPTPPRRPAPPPAPAAAGAEPAQPGLFDAGPDPTPPATTDPYSHIPPRRRWREVLRHAGAPLPPTDTEVPHVV
jgi:hypothetical protein